MREEGKKLTLFSVFVGNGLLVALTSSSSTQKLFSHSVIFADLS